MRELVIYPFSVEYRRGGGSDCLRPLLLVISLSFYSAHLKTVMDNMSDEKRREGKGSKMHGVYWQTTTS